MSVSFYYYRPRCLALLFTETPEGKNPLVDCYNCGWEGFASQLHEECDLIFDDDFEEE